mgnify:CR=1 FL=1
MMTNSEQSFEICKEAKQLGLVVRYDTIEYRSERIDFLSSVDGVQCFAQWRGKLVDLGLNNMIFLLKAHELGLSTLVMGLRDEKKIKELLNIGDEETIVSVIALGYSDVQPSMPKRKDVDSVAKFY